jgi:hypothetical protein
MHINANVCRCVTGKVGQRLCAHPVVLWKASLGVENFITIRNSWVFFD